MSARVKTTNLHLSALLTTRVLQPRPMIYLKCDFKSAGNQHARCLTLTRSTGALSLNAGFHRYHHGLAFTAIYKESIRVFGKMSLRWVTKKNKNICVLFCFRTIMNCNLRTIQTRAFAQNPQLRYMWVCFLRFSQKQNHPSRVIQSHGEGFIYSKNNDLVSNVFVSVKHKLIWSHLRVTFCVVSYRLAD